MNLNLGGRLIGAHRMPGRPRKPLWLSCSRPYQIRMVPTLARLAYVKASGRSSENSREEDLLDEASVRELTSRTLALSFLAWPSSLIVPIEFLL